MKKLLFILLFLPLAGFAQNRADYDHQMKRFVRYYNNLQGDSIINMWPKGDAKEGQWLRDTWSQKSLISMHKQYGKIETSKYLGIDTEDSNPGLAVFENKFSVAGHKTTSFTLNKQDQLETFRFITSSEGIDKLLKKKK